MTTSRRERVWAVLMLMMFAVGGCGAKSDDSPDTGVADAAADASRDAQTNDGADPHDAGHDAAVVDAMTSDATTTDANSTDANTMDANSDDEDATVADADTADASDDASTTCTIGTAQNSATNGTLDLFGAIVYFNDGNPLPAGSYRATYLDGCMKYSDGQAWAVHAYPAPNLGWYLVGSTSAEQLAHLPGAVGISEHFEFEDCVNASKLAEAVEFDHAGGPIGVWLMDSNYPDNVAGIDGRNPLWRLDQLNTTCDDLQ